MIQTKTLGNLSDTLQWSIQVKFEQNLYMGGACVSELLANPSYNGDKSYNADKLHRDLWHSKLYELLSSHVIGDIWKIFGI